jgi:hypothetical protein
MTSDSKRAGYLALVTAGALLALSACEVGSASEAAEPPTTEAGGDDDGLAGIAHPPERVEGAAVGRIEGTENFIAVVEEDGEVRAYLCNGTFANQETLTAVWFRGAWDGEASATLTASGMTLSIERTEDGYRGELTTRDGKHFEFAAGEPDDEAAGLYRVEEEVGDRVIDLYSVVLDSGEVRGAFHTVVTRCRKIRKQVVLADGTTTTIIVEICG